MHKYSGSLAFSKARRKAGVERCLAWLRGRSATLLCFYPLRANLGPLAGRHGGIESIPLAAITGSVDRCGDFTHGFLPLRDSEQLRWSRVLRAALAAKALPPIFVYRAGAEYFVVDGHNRVSVAHQQGLTHIDAHVIDVE